MATTTIHALAMEEEDVGTQLQVKFSGQPPPDEPGSGQRRRRRPQTWVAGFLCFFGQFRQTHTSFPPFLDPLNSFPWSLLQIPHRLKVTTKTKLVDGWIEFFGHHSNCWTKVMVLMSSWSLGLSIDMWFVNFGRRLVSFPFLGCFG